MRLSSKTTAACFLALLALSSLVLADDPTEKDPTHGITGATFPEPGVMTAGQPTGEQLQLLAEDGLKSIIDLRAEDEPRGYDEPEAARQNGLSYVNIPVNLNVLDEATIDRFLDAMRKAKRPVIVHSSSTNRVGAVYYAWLVLEKKVPPAEALSRAMAAGLKQSTMIRKVKKLVAEHKPLPEKPGQKPAQQ
jgi:protein tyrosine phosphatase (PTP) superfamily phosphohydrolase (DUF442 family)